MAINLKSEYNSPDGWEKEVSLMTDDGLLFYNRIKDYWVVQLTNQFRKRSINCEDELINNILANISFYDWHIFLYKLFYYFKKGISSGIFDIKEPVSQCNIPDNTDIRFLYYTNLRIEFCGEDKHIELTDSKANPDEFEDLYNKKEIFLNYHTEWRHFTLLDIAIALHSGVFISYEKYISEAINMGSTEFHEIEYLIPFIDYVPTIFTTRIFKFQDVILNYNSLKESNKAKNRTCNVSESKGIFNILTGEYVQPRDGTFYIDDFR